MRSLIKYLENNPAVPIAFFVGFICGVTWLVIVLAV